MANEQNTPNKDTSFDKKSLLKFVLPSLFGMILFVVPLPYDGNFTIGVGRMADLFRGAFGEMLPGLMTAVVLLSAVLSLIAVAVKPTFVMQSGFLKDLLVVGPLWLISRVLEPWIIWGR